ncbi:MAG: transporter substrate-binding domain-containing protein [Liquorilactobacillus satsumensis]|uniref:transporter substrate-binding domain-containing protein n=1 Tax=Liquorilactobacillus satsumensis TaxID=259059 RepID=UPI0039EB0A31
MKIKKSLLITILVIMCIGLFVSISACGKKSTSTAKETSLEKIKKKGILTVGLSASTAPYEFHNTKNKIVGADVLLIKKIAKKLGVKYKIEDIDFDGLLPALQAKKVDMIVSAMSPTPERENSADFSKVYYKSTNVFVTRKEDAAKYNSNYKLLDQSTVAVLNSSTQQQVVEKYFPNAHLKLLSKSNDLALAVANGKADALLVDMPTAALLEKSNKSLVNTKIKRRDNTAGAAVAMPKNTSKDLKNAVNSVITKYKADYAKWVIQEVKYVKSND